LVSCDSRLFKKIRVKKYNFKVALIGSGKTAEKHAEVIKCFQNYKITSVFSKNLKNAKKFSRKYKIESFYNNFNEFISKEIYDLIIICLPPEKLLFFLSKIINLNSNIFIEKPLGLNLLEAKKILNLYKKRKFSKIKFFVGYNRRFLESSSKLKKILSKENSKYFIDVQDQQDIKIAKNMGHSKKTLINWMYANCIHTIDLFNFLSKGNPTKVVSKKIFLNNCYIIYASINFTNGDIGRYTCYWNIPASWSVTVSTKNNTFKLNPLEKLQFIKKEKNNYKNLLKFDKKFKPGFYNQFNEIDKSLRGKKNYAVTIIDAIQSVKLISKIYDNIKK